MDHRHYLERLQREAYQHSKQGSIGQRAALADEAGGNDRRPARIVPRIVVRTPSPGAASSNSQVMAMSRNGETWNALAHDC